MKWFEGSINEAVATSKSRKAIFVVFVEGKDDTSAQIAEAINTTEVSCRLEQEDFVAIRLESGSDTYRFFAQIYQLVPVPSLFFIGENGTPLEIIAGNTTATDLVTKIDLILTKVGKNKNASINLINSEQKATAADNAINSNIIIEVDKKNDNVIKSNVEVPITQTTLENESKNKIKNDIGEEASTSLKVNESLKPDNESSKSDNEPSKPDNEPSKPDNEPSKPDNEPSKPDNEPSKPINEPSEPVNELSEPVNEPSKPVNEPSEPVNEPSEPVNETKVIPTKELTAEEKIARAQRLIELQNKQRIEEEARKEKEREIERRKIGRDVQKLRQKQHDFEIKQAYEEKMKEKAADAVAREKVLQQIAQDKLERKQKVAIQQQHVQPQNGPEPSEPPIPTATISRIQFRLPSGNPYIAQFEPTNTLRDLRTYVLKNIDLPFRQFAMSTSFPRRELTNEDDDKTLLELELVPTAVILILPLKNSNVARTMSSSNDVRILPQFVWSTFAIFTAVYYYLLGFFTGGSRKSSEEESNNSAKNNDAGKNAGGRVTSNIQNVATTSGLVRRYLGNQRSTTIRSEGNIHRLHSSADDNDENNTWNGNSTQQM